MEYEDVQDAIEYNSRCAFNEGKAEGIAEGEAKGKAEGLAEGKAAGLVEGKSAGLVEGKAAGLAEGLEKGLEKGLAKGKLQIARTMLSMGLDTETIVKATGLSEEEILKPGN